MAQQYNDKPDIQQAHDRVFKEGRSAPCDATFPPGFSEDQFNLMVDELRAIVGGENVHTGDTLLHFSDPFAQRTDHVPSAAVWYVLCFFFLCVVIFVRVYSCH